MIIVDDYKIEWQYSRYEDDELFDLMTRCLIYDKNGKLLASGAAIKSKDDRHEKDTARKISLTRALRDYSFVYSTNILSKEFRTKVWKAYFAR